MRKLLYSPLASPESSLRFNTHQSAPPVSALARSGGPRKMSQLPVSRNSNIERRMDRLCLFRILEIAAYQTVRELLRVELWEWI